MVSRNHPIESSSPILYKTPHEGKTATSKNIKILCSVTGAILFVIAGIVSSVFIGLNIANIFIPIAVFGTVNIFAPIGSIGFIASMTGGSITIVISIGGTISIGCINCIPIKNSKKLEKKDKILPTLSVKKFENEVQIPISVEKPGETQVSVEPEKIKKKKDYPFLLELAETVRNTPIYEAEIMDYDDYDVVGVIPTRDYISLFIHAHKVLPNVYLGDYRGFLSIDPEFIKQYPMTDELQDIFNGEPSTKQREWAKNNLDFLGCSNKSIQTVVSVTRFKPNVTDKEWSTFQPDLEKYNIHRIQIPVDDVDGAWETIEDNLEEIFEHIDNAIQGKGNLLVHCVKGASRSSAVIYAYLMDRCGVTLDQAYNYVLSIRHQAELKPSMRTCLTHYQEDLQRKKHNNL